MSIHGTDYLPKQMPQFDATNRLANASAITTAGTYDGTAITLPSGYAGGLAVVFTFTGLAGGTNITPKLLCGGAVEQTGPTIATASIPAQYRFSIPAGATTVNSRVVSTGTYTAGSYSAFIVEVKI